MGKHQTSVNELKPEFIVRQTDLATGEETRVFKKLQPILADLRKDKRIASFVLKGSAQAIADLDDPKELAELATLTSRVLQTSTSLLVGCTGEQLSYTILKGSKVLVLCLRIGGNQLGIVMEKSADYERILEKFTSEKI